MGFTRQINPRAWPAELKAIECGALECIHSFNHKRLVNVPPRPCPRKRGNGICGH